jgi:hypothetical protein
MLLLVDSFVLAGSDFKTAKKFDWTSTEGTATDGLTSVARRRNGVRRFIGFPGVFLLFVIQSLICCNFTLAFDII